MTDDAMKFYIEQDEQFHLWVGYCISQWSFVDDNLFLIFRDCVGPYDQCSIIYYRVPGLDARLSLTDEIVLSVLPQPERKNGGHSHKDVVAWEKAKKGFKDLLSVRRKIAHHPVVGVSYDPSDIVTSSDEEYWLEISPSQHERLRQKIDHKGLKIQDLKDHYKGVHDLANRLKSFLDDVLKKQHAKPPQPSPELP